MEKLKEAVIKMATARQNKPLLDSQIAQIEHHLSISFPSGLHTPVHPPYAAMIYKAITELNEEGGSTEESISQYIKGKYKELPFAHKSFLSQHLRKLCMQGFVVFTSGNCYVIRNFATEPSSRRTLIRKRVMSRATPPPEKNWSANDESTESKRRRKKARGQLVFGKEDEDEMCNAVTTRLILTKEERKIDSKGRGTAQNESGDSTGMNVMTNALSDHKIIDQEDKQHSEILQPLVQTSFFDVCKVNFHTDGCRCNWYCLDCMNGALCTFCRESHKDHNVIRILRTMWESAVSAADIQKHIDVSEIQTHSIPGKELISLQRTTGSKQRKSLSSSCLICKRFLPESSKFCSLKCKIEHNLASYMPPAAN